MRTSFKTVLLAGGMLLAGPVFAQDATQPEAGAPQTSPAGAVQEPTPVAAQVGPDTPEVADDIVVTGIRSSLASSARVKRESQQIIDTISAENVGKFPDANIAESLRRITGVAIDRSGGEGQFITVRGLGPEFNTVRVNGRVMATDNPVVNSRSTSCRRT